MRDVCGEGDCTAVMHTAHFATRHHPLCTKPKLSLQRRLFWVWSHSRPKKLPSKITALGHTQDVPTFVRVVVCTFDFRLLSGEQGCSLFRFLFQFCFVGITDVIVHVHPFAIQMERRAWGTDEKQGCGLDLNYLICPCFYEQSPCFSCLHRFRQPCINSI